MLILPLQLLPVHASLHVHTDLPLMSTEQCPLLEHGLL